MPTIKVDDEVYDAIRAQAIPYEDQDENDTLRRLICKLTPSTDGVKKRYNKGVSLLKFVQEPFRNMTYANAIVEIMKKQDHPLHPASIVSLLFIGLSDEDKVRAKQSITQTIRYNKQIFQETGKHIFDLIERKVS